MTDHSRARAWVMPPFQGTGSDRLTPSLTQCSWHDWSSSGDAQVENDRVRFVHLFPGKSQAEVERILRNLLAKYDSLRMAFSGAPLSVRLLDPATFTFDVRHPRDRAEALEDAETFNAQPLILGDNWSLRARLYVMRDSILCVMVFHHLIIDGHSVGLLQKDLLRAVSTSEPSAATINFSDYAAHERGWYESPNGLAMAGYWENWLQRQAPLFSPQERKRLDWAAGTRETVIYTLEKPIQAKLFRAARKLETTPFLLLLTVYAMALSRWSGQPRFLVRVNGSLRTSPRLWPLVGNMITADLVECDFEGFQDFAQHLNALTKEYHKSLAARLPNLVNFPAHPDRPELRMMRLGGQGAATINFLSKTRKNAVEQDDNGGALPWPPRKKATENDVWGIPLWPIYLRIVDDSDGMNCKFEFNTSLLTRLEREQLVEQFFSSFEKFLLR